MTSLIFGVYFRFFVVFGIYATHALQNYCKIHIFFEKSKIPTALFALMRGGAPVEKPHPGAASGQRSGGGCPAGSPSVAALRRIIRLRTLRRCGEIAIFARYGISNIERPESGPAGGGGELRFAVAHHCGRRVRQDARTHFAHRLYDRAGGGSVQYPRPHLHQQGRRADARTYRPNAAGRTPPLYPHGNLPLGFLAHSARQRRPDRLSPEFYDLRAVGLQKPPENHRQGTEPGRYQIQACDAGFAHLLRQKLPGDAGRLFGQCQLRSRRPADADSRVWQYL